MNKENVNNSQQWWLSKQGKPVGPYDAAFILDGLRTGKIPPDTYACLVGGKTWKRLCESATFAAACPPGGATGGTGKGKSPKGTPIAGFQRQTMIFAAVTVAVLVVIVVGVLVKGRGNPTWIQAISQSAGQNVVKLETEQGYGTGFVISSKGMHRLILTNRHVLTVEQGFLFTKKRMTPQCRVILASQEKFIGSLVGFPTDPDLDLALIAVECPVLRPLKVRQFGDVTVGEPVVAIGNPLEFDLTVTNGIVSAKRNPYLQHNAAINPGNSGGPLYDQQGRVIGVNTRVRKDSQGLFFSIRADLVLQPQLWTIDPAIKDLLSRVNH